MPPPRTRLRRNPSDEGNKEDEIVKKEPRVNRHPEEDKTEKSKPLRSSSTRMSRKEDDRSSGEPRHQERTTKSDQQGRKSSGKRRTSQESSTRSSLEDSSTLAIRETGDGKESDKRQESRRGTHRGRRRDSSRSQRSAATEESAQYASSDEENHLTLQLDTEDNRTARRKKPRQTRSSRPSEAEGLIKQEYKGGEEEADGREHSPEVLIQPSKGDPNKSPVSL